MWTRVRQVLLLGAGLFSLIYAIWPPTIEFEYLGVAATLLGIEPLAQGYNSASKLREPSDADKVAFDHWMEKR